MVEKGASRSGERAYLSRSQRSWSETFERVAIVTLESRPPLPEARAAGGRPTGAPDTAGIPKTAGVPKTAGGPKTASAPESAGNQESAAAARPVAGREQPTGGPATSAGGGQAPRPAQGRAPNREQRLQPPPEPLEAQHLPPLRARLGQQLLVGVDGHRMSDRAQHRQVGGRIGVRVGGAEVDALPLGQPPDRPRLVGSVDEQPGGLPGVHAVPDLGEL